jgi:rod shape-determining protein MreC
MVKKLSHSRIVIVLVVISVISPFFLLSTRLLPWSGTSRFTMLLQEVVYAFEISYDSVANFASNTWNEYIDLSRAAKENKKLKKEMSLLKVRSIDYEERVLEISRLRQLLGFMEHYEKKIAVAEVIGSPRVAPFLSVRIARGEIDDVKIGMPVVTAEGVVGRVIRSGLKFSDVQLLTDSNFNLDVLLQRTRVRGVLRGLTNGRCLLNLQRRVEIRIGDTIITSGIVGGFPKGIPVGRVIKISYESDNVSQIITVEPWVDYRRVEEVLVLQKPDLELEKIVETAGKEWLEKTLNEAGGANL